MSRWWVVGVPLRSPEECINDQYIVYLCNFGVCRGRLQATVKKIDGTPALTARFQGMTICSPEGHKQWSPGYYEEKTEPINVGAVCTKTVKTAGRVIKKRHVFIEFQGKKTAFSTLYQHFCGLFGYSSYLYQLLLTRSKFNEHRNSKILQ